VGTDEASLTSGGADAEAAEGAGSNPGPFVLGVWNAIRPLGDPTEHRAAAVGCVNIRRYEKEDDIQSQASVRASPE
jgi:hypothetical protein